jgi:hypothetical protein
MVNPSASQDLWQSPGYRRGPPSVRRLPGLCTSTIDDHSRLGFMLVRSLQNISCFMQPVNYRQDHSLPDCLLARLQD